MGEILSEEAWAENMQRLRRPARYAEAEWNIAVDHDKALRAALHNAEQDRAQVEANYSARVAALEAALRPLYDACLDGRFYDDYDESTDLLGAARAALVGESPTTQTEGNEE